MGQQGPSGSRSGWTQSWRGVGHKVGHWFSDHLDVLSSSFLAQLGRDTSFPVGSLETEQGVSYLGALRGGSQSEL